MAMIDDAHVFIPEVFAVHGRFQASKPAVVCGDVTRSWRDFSANINQVANALIAQGIGRGDRVVVLMGNSVEMLEAVFGVVRAGACVVPLSGLLTGEQMHHLIADAQACCVIASSDYRARLDAVDARSGQVSKQGWLAHDPASAQQQSPHWRDSSDWLHAANSKAPNVRYAQTDPFNIIYSSGTTGLPKGIVQTHRARQHWAFSNAIEMAYGSDCRALTTTALYSNGTWLTMLPALFAGGTLYCMPAFAADDFLRIVQRESITHTFMVPAQFSMVLADPGCAGTDLSSLRAVLCAGSPLRRDVKRAVIERLGPILTELYGYSEGFATMLKPTSPEEKFESVGTPVLGFDVRILDDEGRDLGINEVGEIAGYGAGMMQSYYNKPKLTEALIWRDETGRSFIRSGDVGKLDEDGYLYLVDRKKDMIISGGFNVFPKDLEEIIGQHPDISDVAVIGVPHEKWGETPLALVIPATGADVQREGWAESAKDWVNQRLASHQRVADVVIVEDFPRNALGKVIKRELREPYWR